MDQPQLTAGQRIADGFASLTHGVTNDLAATWFNVAYGSGQALPPPYVISHSSDAQVQGLTDLVDGAIDALLGRNDPAQEQARALDRGLSH
jgi:hypothetical protein